MSKEYTSLGLMSGTSGDGIDASIIRSDGISKYEVLFNKYYKYQDNIYETIHSIKEKINNTKDLKNFTKDLKNLERKITMYHVEVVSEISKKNKLDIVGFHGQTIYHNASEKISVQLGDGNLLSKLTKKNIVYNFRENDIKNGGEGAPLTPIFHQLILKQNRIQVPSCVLNIGGISNITIVGNYLPYDFTSRDIGPGNCLIDAWVRKNSKKKFDKDGSIARSGNSDKLILNQALDNFSLKTDYKKSLDVKDFDIFFAKGLSLENGAATLTEFTAKLIADGINHIQSNSKFLSNEWVVCGGGRKNKYLLDSIKSHFENLILNPIEKYKMNGDFIESQAFAYLAIRSLEGMPITFPSTTRCKNPSTGGVLVKNF